MTLEWVNFMVGQLCLNKAVIKNHNDSNDYYNNVLAMHCAVFTSLFDNHFICFPQQHRDII